METDAKRSTFGGGGKRGQELRGDRGGKRRSARRLGKSSKLEDRGEGK